MRVPVGSTVTERSVMYVFQDDDHYDEDGNQVLSIGLFPRNAAEFVAVFKQE